MPAFDHEISCPNCAQSGIARINESQGGRWKRLIVEEVPKGFELLLQASERQEAQFACLQCGTHFFL
jgi:hypothetical protein